tara:strand:- start:81 stop:320 length:240 start_codon:yes stop_codon:yes gene_type:complete
MKTLTRPQIKLKTYTVDNRNATSATGKLISSKTNIDFKSYQKLFVLFIAFCTFLIFPESPKDFEVVCKTKNYISTCDVW